MEAGKLSLAMEPDEYGDGGNRGGPPGSGPSSSSPQASEGELVPKPPRTRRRRQNNCQVCQNSLRNERPYYQVNWEDNCVGLCCTIIQLYSQIHFFFPLQHQPTSFTHSLQRYRICPECSTKDKEDDGSKMRFCQQVSVGRW